jgi:K+-sensing histidine kinase KdpD
MTINRQYISVKFNESQLSERNRDLSILLEMSNLLSASLNLKAVLEGALARVLENFCLRAGRIYLLDEQNEILHLIAFQGLDAEGLERVKLSEGFSGKAVRTRSFIAQHVSELDDRERADFLLTKGLNLIICVPLIALGKVVGVMNLATDELVDLNESYIDLLITIGNQIAIAANNIRLYEHLQANVNEMEAQKKAIEYFAYSISHDLKSPAIGIFGLTRRLHNQCRDALDEKGRLYCDQILKATEQIVRLVDRINAYIMAKEAPLHFEEVKVGEITEMIRNEFCEPLTKRGIRWLEPEDLPAVTADRICLTRVLRNLVDNALKYGGDGLREIKIGYESLPDHHVLSVCDDGVALKVEDSELLFQLFHRNKTSKGVEGTGLGLATVKEITERHGGRVWVESGRETGTTFFFTLSKVPSKNLKTAS